MNHPAPPENRMDFGSIDHEHARLREVVDAACASLGAHTPRERVLEALGLLYVRICAHFALEEKLIREASPSLYKTHKLRCESLLERIRVMMDAFYDGECAACDRSLKDCLSSWLNQHLHSEHPRLRSSRA